ncbi:MAG: helix-turn-helix domain-containing protein [Acidobacteriia bacterium]|nr:helix-turn-helix domain-containing protein [Terriglobia bacterium]
MSEFVSVKAAAEIYSVSVAFWRARIFRRQVPYYRIGRKILFKRKDIDALINNSRIEPQVRTQ